MFKCNSFNFILSRTVWSCERFVVLVCDCRSESVEWRASLWNEQSFEERTTHQNWRIEVSLISTFHIPVQLWIWIGKIDSFPFHLFRVLRKTTRGDICFDDEILKTTNAPKWMQREWSHNQRTNEKPKAKTNDCGKLKTFPNSNELNKRKWTFSFSFANELREKNKCNFWSLSLQTSG